MLNFSDFYRNCQGFTAIYFGLSMMGIISLIGISYDYNAAVTARSGLQNMIEGAAQRAAKESSDPAIIESNALSYLNEMLAINDKNNYYSNIVVDTQETSAEGQSSKYITTVTANIKTALIGQQLGYDLQVTARAITTKKWQEMDVAVVLDFSKVSASQISNLKTAVQSFTQTLLDNTETDQTRIGIVPYSGSVNIKTTQDDYLGNSHNWTKENDYKTIITSVGAHSVTNAARWSIDGPNRTSYSAFYTGNMWQYMDIEQTNQRVNGYYIDAVVHNGDFTDNQTTSFTTLTDGRMYSGKYSKNQWNDNGSMSRYRLESSGDKYLLYSQNPHPLRNLTTAPFQPAGVTFYSDGLRPVSKNTYWGTNNAISNRWRTLAMWNNYFWLYDLLFIEWPGCVMARSPWSDKEYDVLDIPPNAADPESLYVAVPPMALQYIGDYSTQFGANSFGFISDTTNIDTDNTTYNAGLSDWDYFSDIGLYYLNHTINWNNNGPYYYNPSWNVECPDTPLLPLQTSQSTLDNYINSLTTPIYYSGMNSIQSGIKWGWNLVSENAPFTAGKPYGEAKKIMLVVSFMPHYFYKYSLGGSHEYGYNNYGWRTDLMGYSDQDSVIPSERTHFTSENESILNWLDQRTELTCTNAKDTEIEMYTVFVGSNPSDGAVLQNCATDGTSHYYHLTNANDLEAKLTEIANNILE